MYRTDLSFSGCPPGVPVLFLESVQGTTQHWGVPLWPPPNCDCFQFFCVSMTLTSLMSAIHSGHIILERHHSGKWRLYSNAPFSPVEITGFLYFMFSTCKLNSVILFHKDIIIYAFQHFYGSKHNINKKQISCLYTCEFLCIVFVYIYVYLHVYVCLYIYIHTHI